MGDVYEHVYEHVDSACAELQRIMQEMDNERGMAPALLTKALDVADMIEAARSAAEHA